MLASFQYIYKRERERERGGNGSFPSFCAFALVKIKKGWISFFFFASSLAAHPSDFSHHFPISFVPCVRHLSIHPFFFYSTYIKHNCTARPLHIRRLLPLFFSFFIFLFFFFLSGCHDRSPSAEQQL